MDALEAAKKGQERRAREIAKERAGGGARILDCSEADYYNDAIDMVPTLSYSIASTLVRYSPLHAHLEHPRLGGHKWEPSTEMDGGTAVHAMLLEDNPGTKIVALPFDEFRTKEAREARDAVRARGLTPLSKPAHEKLSKAAAEIKKQLAKKGVLLNGRRELALTWDEQGEQGLVRCRGKLDHLDLDTAIIDEIKTTGDANPQKLEKLIANQGYDVQFAAYTSAVRRLLPQLAGREQFRFHFCEIEPPYAVTTVVLDGSYREFGTRRWKRAVLTWEECLEDGYWPAYSDKPYVATVPPYLMQQEEDHG